MRKMVWAGYLPMVALKMVSRLLMSGLKPSREFENLIVTIQKNFDF